VDGEAIPPLTIAVRRHWYLYEYTSLKKRSRIRDIPIPDILLGALVGMKGRPLFTGPDDPVFASRNGTPIDSHNILNGILKPVGKELGMPWLARLARLQALDSDFRRSNVHGNRRPQGPAWALHGYDESALRTTSGDGTAPGCPERDRGKFAPER